MAPNPTIMRCVEHLGYRVTVGDVATQAGLDINFAQQGLLTLASEVGGNLQVADTGEIVYLFPKNFRSVLQNKYLRLRLKQAWEKVWGVLFYLIRISFGIVLVASILLIIVAIAVIIFAMMNSSDSDSGGGGGGSSDGGSSGGGFWISPFDLFWFFDPGYSDRSYQRRREAASPEGSKMNFLEAIFSFLFGDGNPNADLEERRWQEIGAVIRNNNGAIAAEQITPYLDNIGQGFDREYENYVLPVLTRFNGRPEVSPEGAIVYHFPDLQVTAKQTRQKSVPAYLKEFPRRFSEATSGQKMLAIGLGVVNFVGALVLGSLLVSGDIAAQIGFIAFVQAIYGVILGYGVGFLLIPLIRYFWIQWKNQGIERRNLKRQEQAIALNQANDTLQKKIAYAQQFAAQNVITEADLTYTTETDLLDQNIDQSAKIDAEWRRRLEGE